MNRESENIFEIPFHVRYEISPSFDVGIGAGMNSKYSTFLESQLYMVIKYLKT